MYPCKEHDQQEGYTSEIEFLALLSVCLSALILFVYTELSGLITPLSHYSTLYHFLFLSLGKHLSSPTIFLSCGEQSLLMLMMLSH